jgi:hypothetical protein
MVSCFANGRCSTRRAINTAGIEYPEEDTVTKDTWNKWFAERLLLFRDDADLVRS